MPRKTATRKSPAVAFSYLRFSSPEQAKGDSLRRQEQIRDAWLARSGAVLDTSLSLRDEGVSAFSGGHRQNPDRHALAAFLELVRRERIPRGSYLVVESLDRLSREHIRPALTLLLNLIDNGIRIVQLLPVEAVYDEQVEPMVLMQAIMELSRGHSESRMKSERGGRAWQQKRKLATENGKPLTRRIPGWLKVAGGKFVVDEDRGAAVRRIYDLAASGYGTRAITKRLNAERVPTIGRANYWAQSYVAKILGTRAVFGEYQPYTGRLAKRKPDGPPIPNYYPAVIPEEKFHAARAALAGRRHKGGRPSAQINVFQSLWRDARDGSRMHLVHKGAKGSERQIVNYKAQLGASEAKYVSFPLAIFEEAILSRLREIDPREVLPEGNGAADRVLSLTGRLADVEGRIEALKGKMIEGEEIGPLVDVLRKLEANRARAADELGAAQREAASPLSAAWGEARSLLDAMKAAPDPADARARLRGSLRRIVEGIWCLFVTRPIDPANEGKVGRLRVAAVQLWFTGGGAHRDYLIVHRPAAGNAAVKRKAETTVRSFAVPDAGPIDLRRPKDVAKVERFLGTLDLATT
jgi:DNA invertase Pin-like site-specific DNA recombinase